MIIKGLLSIITPAYNSENYIGKLLDSVLTQTYPEIEMFVVDDGSTDNTKSVVQGYIGKFCNRGYTLIYIYQKNQGQSVAINTGLKMIKGEFLVWPDSDDWYSEDISLEQMVLALSNTTDEIGAVRCAYNRIVEDTLMIMRIDYPQQKGETKYFFDDIIKRRKSFWIEPGGWMVKTKFLDSFIPQRSIYTSKNTGQNYQLLLPYLFYKKCIGIERPLFSYLMRNRSHSHGLYDTFEKKIQQHHEVWKTQTETIKSLKGQDLKEIEHYLTIVNRRMSNQQCMICFQYNKQKEYRRLYNKRFDEYHTLLPIKGIILYICSFFPYSFQLINKAVK